MLSEIIKSQRLKFKIAFAKHFILLSKQNNLIVGVGNEIENWERSKLQQLCVIAWGASGRQKKKKN